MLTLNPVDEQELEEAACHALWGGEGLGKPVRFRLGGGQEELVEVAERLESGKHSHASQRLLPTACRMQRV